jgi:hypothetical protein
MISGVVASSFAVGISLANSSWILLVVNLILLVFNILNLASKVLN